METVWVYLIGQIWYYISIEVLKHALIYRYKNRFKAMSGNIRVFVTIQKYYRFYLIGWIIVIILASRFLPYNLYIGATSWEYKLPLFVVSIFIFHGLIKLIMTCVSRNIGSVLYRDCDPIKFTNIQRIIISELQKLKRSRDLTVCHLYICTGLIANGEYEEAFHELEQCGSFRHNKKGTILRCVFYMNHCLVSIHKYETAIAKNYLDLMKKEMAWLKHRSKKRMLKSYLLVSQILNITEGNYYKAGSFFSDRFQKAKNNYHRAFAKFYLGEIYFHNGDALRAKEAFEYATQHGNKLYIAQQARERLKEMDSAL